MSAAMVCITAHGNRQELIRQLENRWLDVLTLEYIKKTTTSTWGKLRRIVDAKGSYIEDIYELAEEANTNNG